MVSAFEGEGARPGGRSVVALAPGVALCAAIGVAALALERVETGLFGRAWIEALVIAILLGMTPHAYGVLAGLTVYAVPQVLAAAAPISSLSAQVGTVVKLIRVLMLGPVVLALSLFAHRLAQESGAATQRRRPPLGQLEPWFILGFLALAAARSAGFIPEAALEPVSTLATGLTILSMAALGLGVDLRTVAKTGARVTAVVTLSRPR